MFVDLWESGSCSVGEQEYLGVFSVVWEVMGVQVVSCNVWYLSAIRTNIVTVLFLNSGIHLLLSLST